MTDPSTGFKDPEVRFGACKPAQSILTIAHRGVGRAVERGFWHARHIGRRCERLYHLSSSLTGQRRVKKGVSLPIWKVIDAGRLTDWLLDKA